MDELDPRQREVLRAIVHEHVATGEPVGSSAIARRAIAASSATVRSVMADLEALGLLEKPHTSAGRVPTERGYRYYVDTLVQVRPPPPPEQELIAKSLPAAAPADDLLRETGKLLSALSHHATVITTPSLGQIAWKRVEFVRLREDRVLAILMSPAGLVRNRLLTVDFSISADELARAADYLNELISDAPLEAVRQRLLDEIANQRSEYDALEQKALQLGRQVFETSGSPLSGEVLIEGRQSFFEAPEFADVGRMRALFLALEEKSKLLAVLDRTLSGSEVQIFLGADTEFSARTGASVVAARYCTDAGVVGSIGILGPTRMDYSRAIALVDFTAGLLSRLLEDA